MSKTIFNQNEADFDPESMISEEEEKSASFLENPSNKDIEDAIKEAEKVLTIIPPLPGYVAKLNPEPTSGMLQISADQMFLSLYSKSKLKSKIKVYLIECDYNNYSFSLRVIINREHFEKIFSFMIKDKTLCIKNPILKEDQSFYLIKNFTMSNTEKNMVLLNLYTDRR